MFVEPSPSPVLYPLPIAPGIYNVLPDLKVEVSWIDIVYKLGYGHPAIGVGKIKYKISWLPSVVSIEPIEKLAAMILPLPPKQVAEVLEVVPPKRAAEVLEKTPPDISAKILEEVKPSEAGKIMDEISIKPLSEIIKHKPEKPLIEKMVERLSLKQYLNSLPPFSSRLCL